MIRRPKILIVPGSIRSGSYNVRLAGAVYKRLGTMECEPSRISLRDFPMPIYDADLESDQGRPENTDKLARMFHEQDGIILVSPEYNASIPPLLKNTTDWISRIGPKDPSELRPYKNAVFALASASPGRFGGARGLNHLRASLVSIGAMLVSNQLSVVHAGSAFDENEELADDAAKRALDAFCREIVEKAALFSRHA